MTNPSQDQINALINLYYSGQMTLAEQACKELLQIYPRSSVILNVFGAILKEQGRLQEALQTFDKSIQVNPDYAQAYNNRGIALKEHGQLEKAVASYDKAIQLKPDFEDAYCNRGIALQELGQIKEAVESYNKAIQLKPDCAEAYSNRANALQELGQIKEAVESYDKAIQCKPDFAEAYSNRGTALKELGQFEKAVESYDKAIQFKPDFAEAYNNRGTALRELGQLEEAVESYEKAIQFKPGYVEPYFNLCGIYEKKSMVSELKKILHQAQEVLPENAPQLLYCWAQLASRERRIEEARNLLEQISPEKLPTVTRMAYSELLAKTYDKLGLYAKAFAQFEITNEITRQSFNYQKYRARRYLSFVSQSAEYWTNVGKLKWPVRQTPTHQPSLTFLVGFPRSGTTLLDTILRSHPEVLVVEEKPMVETMLIQLKGDATPDLLTRLNDKQIDKMREVYWEELLCHEKLDGSHRIIIDKLPLNIIHIGLINRVFPDAKFILALRHPYDCVLSCFMQCFELNDAMANFLTLQQSAKLYDAVMNLWTHYNNALDLEVGISKYEDLVQNLQGTAESLLNFLGLDWHDNLLNYQQTALSREWISTPSYNQVTQSLYTQAIGRWKNYRDQINVIASPLKPWAEKFGYSTEY